MNNKEGQLQVVDDVVDYGIVGEKGDNLHRAPAMSRGGREPEELFQELIIFKGISSDSKLR